jgi:enediyne biosynthesis protein E4
LTSLARTKLPVGLTLVVLCASSQAIEFANVSEAAGFTPTQMHVYEAGGIAVADFNGNGYPDIFVSGGYHPNRLYFNQGDGSFADQPAINAMLAGDGCGVAAAADFDNDGWPDIYVGCRNSGNHLFRNLQGQGFEDVTPPELKHDLHDPTRATRTDAIAWGDLTGNGYLDLYIGVFTGWSEPHLPENFDRIMLNNGDGTWTNAAENIDLGILNRQALAVMIGDLTDSGRPDIYVVNDKLSGNVLWRNDGPGCDGVCLTDISEETGTDTSAYGMGIAVGDVSLNGKWDLYFSSIDEQHLLRGTGKDPLEFTEDVDSPLNHLGVGWATIFADFDNSGHEDAYLALGSGAFAQTPDHDVVFRNQGDGTFVPIYDESGLHDDINTHAAARIDFNRNGRIDLVLQYYNQGYRIFENVSEDVGHWIGFELEGGGPINRDAIGTLVIVETADGSVQRRELRAGESRGASHDRVLHFGLGDHETADVTVHWPDGLTESLGEMSGGCYIQLTYPDNSSVAGCATEPPPEALLHDRFELQPNGS